MCLSERVIAFRPVIVQQQVPQVRVADEVDAQQFPHFPLDPLGRRAQFGDGIHGRLFMLQQQAHGDQAVLAVQRPVVHHLDAFRGIHAGGDLQPRADFLEHHLGCLENRFGGDVDVNPVFRRLIELQDMVAQGADPLPDDLIADFLRNVASRRTAAPESATRTVEKLVRALSERYELEPREVAVVQAFGRFGLERLSAECGGLDPGVPPDRRFVSCLIMDSPEGE